MKLLVTKCVLSQTVKETYSVYTDACIMTRVPCCVQILDEADRSLHDALCVLSQTVKETRTVYGGGCSEMLMAEAVSQLAAKTPGKEAIAMEVCSV